MLLSERVQIFATVITHLVESKIQLLSTCTTFYNPITNTSGLGTTLQRDLGG